MQTIPCYDIFELSLNGPSEGNPFTDVELSVRFQIHNRCLESEGFYDGDGCYRFRLMPDEPGEWRYETHSNISCLDGQSGGFICVPARPGIHGPVRVADQFHFAYADGSRYAPFGTTCYAWVHQEEKLERRTLETLKEGYFNKTRMCVFPKDYTYNKNEPRWYPFEQSGREEFNYNRPNPAFWRHFEQRVGELAELGIESDLILFHPYDRWGFSKMPAQADDCYLRYAIARLAAYRNVWWSLANEYDLMPAKKMTDWDRYFHILQEYDPTQHLRSVHNCSVFYDHAKPWVTHVSAQHADTSRIKEWREQYRKPVVVDECGYEGDIVEGWGNSTPQEHLRRIWVGFCRGGYVGHGETYFNPEEILWWSKGGILRGLSPEHIRFLHQIVEQAPGALEPTDDWYYVGARVKAKYYLFYLDSHQPRQFVFGLPEGEFRADIIDTWEMAVTPVDETFRLQLVIPLPIKPYLAVRIQRVDHGLLENI